MKKILIGFSVFLMTLVSAQNYPDYYPTNNSNYYGDEDDSGWDNSGEDTEGDTWSDDTGSDGSGETDPDMVVYE